MHSMQMNESIRNAYALYQRIQESCSVTEGVFSFPDPSRFGYPVVMSSGDHNVPLMWQIVSGIFRVGGESMGGG